MKSLDDIQMKLRMFRVDLGEFKNELSEFVAKTEGRFDRLYNLVDGLAGDFKKFDEEQTVLSGNQGLYNSRFEKLEKKVFGRTA